MLARSLQITYINLFNQYKHSNFKEFKRNVQVSVIGASSELGSNVALLLKLNNNVGRLQLYDDLDEVRGIGMELDQIPGGPAVTAYAGVCNLGPCICDSDIILMTTGTLHSPDKTTEEMIAANALVIQRVCRAMVKNNPKAFLAISTNPINCVIPFVSALFHKYNCYNPYKTLGITQIDTIRSKVIAGNALQVNPQHLHVPVIGGHSDETIIPLYSNLTPGHLFLDPCYAETLTRRVRKAETEVFLQKQGKKSAISAVAWSIHAFIDGLINAVRGHEVILNCFTANPHYGTRFFSGPTSIGFDGIIQTFYEFPMNDYESNLLIAAIPLINRDVSKGEQYVRHIAAFEK